MRLRTSVRAVHRSLPSRIRPFPSFRDGPSGAGPEPMHTDQVLDFSGPCSWVPGSRAMPAPRNDSIHAFFSTLLVLRTIQTIQQTPFSLSRGPSAHGLDPWGKPGPTSAMGTGFRR